MKTRIILLLLVSFLFMFCSDDDKDDIQNGNRDLRQTVWKGEIFNMSDKEINDKGSITIQFINENRGNYEFKFESFISALFEDFKYQINDKLIQLEPVTSEKSTYLKGDWIIQKHTSDSLVITNNLHLENSYIIRVKKIE